MSDIRLIYTTWPTAETAHAAAAALVEQGLAACANILAPMNSIFRWQGRTETAVEIPVLFKTTTGQAAELVDRIASLHPYEVPAIVAWEVDEAASHAPFLDWIRES
ncbi:MAG: CutA1 divalent ion tolerance protein [Caulobacteraceae bacterium]|nr:CutA1 divalent ion tolerance protein [Caulobacteraceae bacterium]